MMRYSTLFLLLASVAITGTAQAQPQVTPTQPVAPGALPAATPPVTGSVQQQQIQIDAGTGRLVQLPAPASTCLLYTSPSPRD